MDWTKGFSTQYYATEVDPITWRDIRRIDITGGQIKRTISGLRNSATIDCLAPLGGIELWVRIYMDCKQNGSYAHEALFTGLAASPKRQAYATRDERSPNCYSVLKPADDVILPRGYYASAGADGGEVIRSLLSVSPAPIEIADGAPALSATIVAEDNETRLSMANRVVEAIGWRLDITGDGTIRLMPYSAVPVATFDPFTNDVIEVPINVTEDWYSAPNVYMAVADDLTGIARDEDEDSPLSIQNRGREVWKVETGVSLSTSESIAQYAQRRLREAQRVRKKASYDRRYNPAVGVGDVINLHYPQQDIDGLYMVASQSVKIGYGASTAESVEEL